MTLIKRALDRQAPAALVAIIAIGPETLSVDFLPSLAGTSPCLVVF